MPKAKINEDLGYTGKSLHYICFFAHQNNLEVIYTNKVHGLTYLCMYCIVCVCVCVCVCVYVCMYVPMSFISGHPRAFQIQEQRGKGVTRSDDRLDGGPGSLRGVSNF